MNLTMIMLAALGLGLADEGYRHTFLRGEENAYSRPSVKNFTAAPVKNVKAKVKQYAADGKTVLCERVVEIGDVGAGETKEFRLPVETRLKPTDTLVKIAFTSDSASGESTAKMKIAPALRENAFTTLMWGSRGSPISEPASLGFTHDQLHGIGWTFLPDAKSSKVDMFKQLDNSLAVGVKRANQLTVTFPEKGKAERDENAPINDKYMRRSRKGEFKVRPWGGRTFEIGQPALIEHAVKIQEASVRDFGDHPGFGAVLNVSERRDVNFPSFNTEHLRYKAETGKDVPEDALYRVWSTGLAKRRYRDGIVPVDDPDISYYYWFWNHGDGWPTYSTAIANTYREGMKKWGRKDFFSYWDPAMRCPYVWGSGGNVDYLNQWCYATPDPLNVTGPTEEMFAMAKGYPGQQVMMMTQLICYRSEMAPTNVVPKNLPEWMSRVPNAQFPTIPPDTLEEAIWGMIAKPIKGIMFHGWGTISPTLADNYRSYTCPATRERLKKMLKGPVLELGPMLLKLGRVDPEVAVHCNGLGSLCDGPCSWGWRSPHIRRVITARLDPRVVFDEEIKRDGFGNAKVLYLWGEWIIDKDILAKILDFQKQGGIIVGEDDTLAAIKPDIVVPTLKFTAPKLDITEWNDLGADNENAVKTILQDKQNKEQAEQLRTALAAKGYVSKTGSSSPEIITFNRQWKEVPYVFAINDKRTFGDYIGQWGMMMEKALPNSGTVFVRDPMKKINAVYELAKGGEVAFSRDSENKVVVPVSYTTTDARVLAFLGEKIDRVNLEATAPKEKGGKLQVKFSVLNAAGKPVQALLPVEIRVFDGNMTELDGAGWTVAEDGVATLNLATNLDDLPGCYTVIAKDRASGYEASITVK